ncbi:hypothetical protein F5878DRAFT_543078, partial [Lentinula raphanica]
SELRPHCTAKERLRRWRPANARTFRDSEGNELDLPDEINQRVEGVMEAAFAEGTLQAYASGLLAFHAYCDARNLSESQCTPCSSDLLQSWIATMAGTYAGTSVKNYVHGLKAWHIMHGIEWTIDKAGLDTIIRGAESLQPEKSKRKKWIPFTENYIEQILGEFNLDDPFDAACGACLTTGFYCAARVGELTVPTLKAFNPRKHVTTSQIRRATDRNGFETTVIHVPSTKTSQIEGEDIYFSRQLNAADPERWLNNHLAVNKPEPNEHLFSYQHQSGGGKASRRPLTKAAFIQKLQKVARNKGLQVLQGHGIRIGATLEYLLRGVPFNAVRVIGRWQSDAFLLYLRKHAEIMAPYLQPKLHQQYIKYTMPPVRCECTPNLWGTRGRWMRRTLLPI